MVDQHASKMLLRAFFSSHLQLRCSTHKVFFPLEPRRACACCTLHLSAKLVPIVLVECSLKVIIASVSLFQP
ncbi:hypothetical protein L0F63_004652, partial [Massospora cicadina]